MARTRKGPSRRRCHCCVACGHSLFGKSAFQARPIAYREIEFAGRGRIRVVRTVYLDELSDTELRAQVLLVVVRLAEILGLQVENDSKVSAELELRKQQVFKLQRAIALLVDRKGEERPHREPKRARVRAGERRTASLFGTPVKVRPGPRREDSIDVAPVPRNGGRSTFDAFASAHRPAQRAQARPGAKREDGLS